MADEQDDDGRSQRAVRSATTAALTSAAVVAIPAWRLLAVAHLDQPVALEMARLVDPAAVILGIAISVLPLALSTLAIGWLRYLLHIGGEIRGAVGEGRPGSTTHLPAAVVDLLAWVGAISFLPWPVATLLVTGVAVLVWVAWSRPPRTEQPIRRPARLGLLAAGTLMLGIGGVVTLADDTPWVPATELRVSSKTVVGYVLDESHDQVVLLRASDRQVVYVSRNEIVERRICRTGAGSRRSLVQVVVEQRATSVRCPRVRG